MTANPFRLDGQLALVTGGGTGIGLAISQALIDAGARVVITGRRAEVLQQACRDLGPHAGAVQNDLADLGAIPGLVETVRADYGEINILVNNAGFHQKKPFDETTDADMQQMLQTHLLGSFAISRECGKAMVTAGRGSIVMIVSMAALFGLPKVAAYSAAKSALLGLTRTLAVEMSPSGVRVNAVAPGFIETDLSRKAFAGDPQRKTRVLARTPMARLGQPSDIGYAVVYLCSDAAKFVTGAVLPVDGGVSIGF